MTSNESFKRRIRARMARTGERYGAARRALVEQAIQRADAARPQDVSRRPWVAEPETSDAAVAAATGRGWDEWVDLVESGEVDRAEHAAVAAWLAEEHGLDGWWSQTVTVGWERITGRRLPGQRPDGTFTATVSRTVELDGPGLDAALRDASSLADLFPDLDVELRSRPGTRSVRLGMPVGVALVTVARRGDGRATVTVNHEKLPDHDRIRAAKEFWSTWIATVADS